MKAFILAAGLGTRLRPLTENQPKVMVEVAGKKILERTIEQLKLAGINDLVINTHYFPEVVPNYFGNGEKWGVKIEYSFEPEILGTAGALKKVEEKFKNENEFLVVYGDNVFDLDFKNFVNSSNSESACQIMLFDRTKSPNSGIAGGVVEVKDGMVAGFYEGVSRPEIPYVNGGVYKCTPKIFELIPRAIFYDFGKQVFPEMIEKKLPLAAYIINEKEALFGVDNMECLERANNYFKK